MDRKIPKEVLRSEKRKRWIKTCAIILGSVGVIALIIFLLRDSISLDNLQLSTVDTGSIEVSVSASGKVVAAFEETVIAPIESRIVKVFKKAGDRVDEGTPLLQLDPQSIETDYRKMLDELEMRRYRIEQQRVKNSSALSDMEMQLKVNDMQIDRMEVEVRNERYLDSIGAGTTDKVREVELSYNVAKLEQEQAYKKLENDRSVADAELRVQELELEIFRKSLAETKRILEDAQWSNRSHGLHRDTLSTRYPTLNRTVTPDFFRVFRYQSTNGSTDELVRALERGELVISTEVEKELFGKDESAVGQYISFEKSDSAQQYTVGAVSDVIRYDNFSNWSAYFAQRLENDLLESFSGEWVGGLEFCVRVTPEEDHDFIRRFREDMSRQLRLGNYYLGDIRSIPAIKEATQLDNVNDLKMRMFDILFLLVNILLGIIGIFWFRTQHRRSEIGLRVSLGDTSAQVLKRYYTEGLLLLTAAMIPALIIIYILGREAILQVYLMPFTATRYLIGFGITYLLLAGMIILGIWLPARKAVKVPPAEALRDE